MSLCLPAFATLLGSKACTTSRKRNAPPWLPPGPSPSSLSKPIGTHMPRTSFARISPRLLPLLLAVITPAYTQITIRPRPQPLTLRPVRPARTAADKAFNIYKLDLAEFKEWMDSETNLHAAIIQSFGSIIVQNINYRPEHRFAFLHGLGQLHQ